MLGFGATSATCALSTAATDRGTAKARGGARMGRGRVAGVAGAPVASYSVAPRRAMAGHVLLTCGLTDAYCPSLACCRLAAHMEHNLNQAAGGVPRPTLPHLQCQQP